MYKIFIGNPYDAGVLNENDVLVATTNGVTRKNGYAVMGKGSAEPFKTIFSVDKLLGEYLRKYGNRAFFLGKYSYTDSKGTTKHIKLATFPTKHHWRDKSDLELIEASAIQIKAMADKFNFQKVYIPIPGCSNGQLSWKQVKEKLNILDERFIIYSFNASDFNM